MEPILHMAVKADWQNAQKCGAYRPPSLHSEGFIHCSSKSQVLDTANRYFIDRQDLILLWIDPQKIKTELRWEASHGEMFPHIYGPLNLDAIFQVQEFHPGPDGRFAELPGF